MMKTKLSNRLKIIADRISEGAFFADIGSDHAYLPCYVCLKNKRARAIAGEVAKGPFERALQTVKENGLIDRIDVRLGDGLQVIKQNERMDEIVIAGMGGGLISSILQQGSKKLSDTNKIFAQPNTNAKKVRETLLSLDFTLIEEFIIEENNQFYEILIAENCRSSTYDTPYLADQFDKQLYFGPYLLKNRPETFIKKWEYEREKLTKVISRMQNSNDRDVLDKVAIFQRYIQWIEEVIR